MNEIAPGGDWPAWKGGELQCLATAWLPDLRMHPTAMPMAVFDSAHRDPRTVKDSKGRLIPTVVASNSRDMVRPEQCRENELLVMLLDSTNRKDSQSELARR